MPNEPEPMEPRPMSEHMLATLRKRITEEVSGVGIDLPWWYVQAIEQLLAAHDFFRVRAIVTETDVSERGIDCDKAVEMLRDRGVEMPAGQFFGSPDTVPARLCNLADVPWDALELCAKECKR